MRSDGAFISDVARWKVHRAKQNLELAATKYGEKSEEHNQAREQLDNAILEMMDSQNIDDDDIELDGFHDDYEDTDNDEADYERELNEYRREEEEDDDDDEFDEEENDDDINDNYDSDSDEICTKEPPSFSKIDPVSLHKKIPPKQFQLLSQVSKYSFEVHEGEMVYLPACKKTNLIGCI